MKQGINRRDFIKSSAVIGGLSIVPSQIMQCGPREKPIDFLYTLPEYDIFAKIKTPKKIYRFDTTKLQSDNAKQHWIMLAILSIYQGLINRTEPRIYLKNSPHDVDWLSIYASEGYAFELEDVPDVQTLLQQFINELDGAIIIDPDNLHSLNVAQTWASLENLLVITPEMKKMVQAQGLAIKEDLRGRWKGRIETYLWAFKKLFPHCSKHLVANCCVDYPFAPSPSSYQIRDFLVANHTFTVDLSSALRQRREYRLLNEIYARMELPAGIWGWHCSRDHEHWAVDRGARKGLYTVCAAGGANFTVHSGFKPTDRSVPQQKPSPRKDLKAQKDKVYIAFMMTDGDALWVMDRLQMGNWGAEKRREFPISWGFLPLLADIGPAMYKYYVDNMNDTDYMVAGPSGAGYTYTHLHPNPRLFLRYSKHYMQRCDLKVVHITNWNDYTNWQEVDVPWFNPILFTELDNCVGYVRGMGESAFEPNYNFKDKPFVFCGEGIHRNDKDDVATIRNFIQANPNRPLFVFVLINVAVDTKRIQRIVDELTEYNIEYVRLDDFMHLIKSAYNQGLITEDLYPNRKGNEQIMRQEAPANWRGTKANIEKLIPILRARSEEEALSRMNSPRANLAKGQAITNEDKADVLAFELCKNMFRLVKNVLNYKGIYVNKRIESVQQFIQLFGNWDGIASLPLLVDFWRKWDSTTIKWKEIVRIGRDFIKIYQQADQMFK